MIIVTVRKEYYDYNDDDHYQCNDYDRNDEEYDYKAEKKILS